MSRHFLVALYQLAHKQLRLISPQGTVYFWEMVGIHGKWIKHDDSPVFTSPALAMRASLYPSRGIGSDPTRIVEVNVSDFVEGERNGIVYAKRVQYVKHWKPEAFAAEFNLSEEDMILDTVHYKVLQKTVSPHSGSYILRSRRGNVYDFDGVRQDVVSDLNEPIYTVLQNAMDAVQSANDVIGIVEVSGNTFFSAVPGVVHADRSRLIREIYHPDIRTVV